MAITPKREIELIAAAIILDNDRGDRKFTCVEALGYTIDLKSLNPAVLTAAHAIHDLVEAGNDPIKLFSKQIAEYKRMELDGGLCLHRAALRDTQIARNAPCHCGSGKKYKKCCYWKDGAAATGEKTKGGKSFAARVLAAMMALLAGADTKVPLLPEDGEEPN